MHLKLQTKTDPSTPTLIALFQEQKLDRGLFGVSKWNLINLHLKQKNFKAEAGETVSTHLVDKTRTQKIILFGLGKESEWKEKQARNMASKMIRTAKSFKEKEITFIIPEKLQSTLQPMIEGIILGNYDPVLYKTGEEKQKREDGEIKTLNLLCHAWTKVQENTIHKAQLLAEVVNYVRNLVNSGPDKMNTEAMVSEAKAIAKENKYGFTDFNKRQLEKMGMGGILAVNRGSIDPAHLLVLEHEAKLKEEPIIIVGKGIIFDTGGVSLKPSSSLHDMHLDMAGAAVILGVFKLLKKLDIKRRVIGLIPVTDNSIGSKAYRPSEIVTTYSGKTVEIMNTDAEGRMILCDALYYGATKYKPRYMIDLATLTGACMVALGFRTAGLFGNDQALVDLIKASCENTDEPACQLPITDADEKAMKGKLADLTNLAMDHGYAGSSRAAAFLKNFVNNSKWAHLDIAGTAFTKDPKDYEVPMATGFGVRLLIDFLEKL
ncbi:MAG: M17 family metallopeptidase [Candidatus Altimarinota bacterium]